MKDSECVPLNLSDRGEVLATVNNKIALIDADTVVYRVCSTNQEESELFPRRFYTDEEWNTIVNDCSYVEGCTSIRTINIELALEKVERDLEDILHRTGCKEYELHFTSGRNNFRYIICPDYKANRKEGSVPVGIADLKQLLLYKYPDRVFSHTHIEADDAVIAKYNPDKYILCAIDKDVLYSVAGTHFNYYHSGKYNIEPKFIEVDEITAIQQPYIQTLTGDTTDNIIGLHMVGAVGAKKLLGNITDTSVLWEIVERTYKAKGRTVEEAKLNFRLVDMHQVEYINNEFILKEFND